MKDRKIRLLLIEDDKVDQMAFERSVKKNDLPYDYSIAGSIAEARKITKSINFDVIISDYMLGDGVSFELFDLFKDIPVIVTTGTGNEEIAVEAMKLGAWDYLIKDPEGNYLTTLPATVELALKRKQNEKELQNYQENLESMIKERTAQLYAEIIERKKVESELKKKNIDLEKEIKFRKQAEEKIFKSKMLLESSIESPKDMIILSLDHKYRYLYFNSTHADTMIPAYGKRPNLGDCIFDYMAHEGDIKKVKAHYDQAMAGDGHSVIEEYGEGKARFYYEIQYNPIYNEKKEIIGITSFAQNITDRRKQECALQESEEKYSSLFKNNHSVMLIIDPQTGNIVDVNPAACSYYGYSRAELTQKKIKEINLLSDEETQQEMNRAKLEQHNHFFFRHRLANNEIRDVEAYSGPIILQGKSLLYSIIHDITDRRQAEKELAMYHEQLEEMVENRTRELEDKNKELDKAMKVFVGRELKIRDLEGKIKVLEGKE